MHLDSVADLGYLEQLVHVANADHIRTLQRLGSASWSSVYSFAK